MTQRLTERVPTEPGWVMGSGLGAPPNATRWHKGGLVVISELIHGELPDGDGKGWQWLVSVSLKGRRANGRQARRALRAFDMLEAEEDNHGPGNARSFFLVVDPARRVACQCKTDETTHRDPDGYKWTTPANGPCSGCEYAPITGRSCPIHGGAQCPRA